MTLHEAIQHVLKNENGSMLTKEIADRLNENKFYTKKDKSAITDFQIHGRTKNYPQLFNQNGSEVSLVKN